VTLQRLRWSACGLLLALAACGGGSSGSSAVTSVSSVTSVFAAGGPNVVTMTVTSGPPASTQQVINIPYVSVTVCSSPTSCATIDHVLVDTGSSGLRLLHSALPAGFALASQTDPANPSDTLAECLPFAGSYSWGVTATADVRIGGESASGVPVQIIDDDNSYAPATPKSCKAYGANENVSSLDANGLLGVSVLTQDCGVPCASSANNGRYFSCGASVCGSATAPLANQVVNPVTLFATDNNGVILQLPAIPDGGAATATGYLVFGIGTQGNNGLGTATVLATTSNGEFVTSFNGQALSGSFIDSGSNGLYFTDAGLPTCQGSATQFYCPATTQELSATNQSQTGVLLPTSFAVANVQSLSKSNFALDDVAGGLSSNINLTGDYFDWGLPFFYGRTVYVAFEGMAAGGSMGPYYAY
jgi:hypothetical protein